MTNTQLPRVNWPQESREFKVVQLYLNEEPILAFEHGIYDIHAGILMYILGEADIDYQRIKGRTGATVPALQGEGYRVSGMGKATVSIGQKIAKFYGESTEYGLGIDPAHLEAIRKLEPDWTLEL